MQGSLEFLFLSEANDNNSDRALKYLYKYKISKLRFAFMKEFTGVAVDLCSSFSS